MNYSQFKRALLLPTKRFPTVRPEPVEGLKRSELLFSRSYPSTSSGRTEGGLSAAFTNEPVELSGRTGNKESKKSHSVRTEPVEVSVRNKVSLPIPAYKKGESIATRTVYGESLVALGAVCEQLVSLDAEVKNSTYAELFEQVYPDRFYQCFIAEQNMVSMGVGFDRRGLIPFLSTFAAFFSRAHDQLRMAAIGQASLKLCGSHAGVSIGHDGPSQMGLEDIAIMRGLPKSIVLYPCDAVSTYKLMQEMANYHDGISYLRITRMATPVIYDAKELFPVGGCKILKQSVNDRALVIAAGITVHEALKAHAILAKEGISIAVIDLYCVKPLDVKTISEVAKACNNTIVTVEDHYQAGGIGEAVSAAVSAQALRVYHLAVNHLSRSGKPEELLADAGIDAHAIVKRVKQL